MPEGPVSCWVAIRGHRRECDFLKSAVAGERLPHALLFCGPDGVGKRLVAVALAAWLQCEAVGDDACGTCAACRQVAAGTHPDVQLVALSSGKKEIGIDRMREIKKFMQLKPLRGKAKVAIVDSAHALTAAAQNAVLKTLEEPPDQSFLILVANTPDALLATVRSRCQRLQFSPLAADVVAEILAVTHGVDPVLARELAALAEGSPGRALALRAGVGKLDGAGVWELLAGLRSARYVDMMELASRLAESDAALGVNLEILLSQCRDAVTEAIDKEPEMVRSALTRTEAVHSAHSALRRTNANRQLLIEALLLQLTRT